MVKSDRYHVFLLSGIELCSSAFALITKKDMLQQLMAGTSKQNTSNAESKQTAEKQLNTLKEPKAAIVAKLKRHENRSMFWE